MGVLKDAYDATTSLFTVLFKPAMSHSSMYVSTHHHLSPAPKAFLELRIKLGAI